MSLVSTALSSALSLSGLPRTLAVYGLAVSAVVAKRIAQRVVLYLALAALFGIGAAFLTAAGFMALTNVFGAIHAALIVGGGFVIVGVILLIVMRSDR